MSLFQNTDKTEPIFSDDYKQSNLKYSPHSFSTFDAKIFGLIFLPILLINCYFAKYPR